MIENTILWLCIIWMPLLIYFMLRNETKFKKNIAIGVTLPFEGRTHPDVLARLEKFKKQELLVCIGLILLGLPGIFLDFSTSFTVWLSWVTASIILPYIPYVLCNRDLKKIKAENGWKQSSSADTVTVDLGAIPDQKWLSPLHFVPPLILSILPILFERTFAIMYLVDTLFIASFWLGYRYLFRNKAEIVDNNTSVTIALTRFRRSQWGKMWLLCAYSMAALNWITLISMDSPIFMSIGFVLFMVVILSASMYVEFKTRKVQETLTANSGKDFYVDDDDKWLGGLIYYNPNDSRTVINNRIGTNSTVNLATPVGKVLHILLALFMLTLPFWGTFLGDGSISTDITLDSVYIKGGMHKYTIVAEDVIHAELLEELPSMTRVSGTGMPNFLGGTFSSKDYGKVTVCLNPTAPPFVLAETEDTIYILGTNEPAQTQAIYNALK